MARKTLKQRTTALVLHSKRTATYGLLACVVASTATHLIPGSHEALQTNFVPVIDVAGSGLSTALQAIGAVVADVWATATHATGK